MIDLYRFIAELSRQLPDDAVVVSDAGSAMFVCYQGLRLNGRQHWIQSAAQAEMGFTIPACIGVAATHPVVGITGDGSFQMNVQELQTIVYHRLPVKLFVWNNGGYLSIRNTQDRYFDGRHIGTDKESGVSFPDMRQVVRAYGLPYLRINEVVDYGIKRTLETEGPIVCEVMCDPEQVIRRRDT